MKLTIEKAKEIVKHYIKTDEPMEGDIHGSDMAWGFIAGWNQAIETIEKGIVESQNPLSVDRESVLIFVRNLKVEGEK